MILLSTLPAACSKDENNYEDKIENSITIKDAPVKVEYYNGDALDLSGLVVELNMNNGKSKVIAFSDFDSNGITCLPVNGTILSSSITEIKITSSQGKTVVQAIKVNEVLVTDIAIKATPTKVDYFEGESLNLAGLVVTITKNNGEIKDVSFTDFESNGLTCSPGNGTGLLLNNTQVTILHTSSGKKVVQPLTINKVLITGIAIKTLSIKTEYFVGETLDLTGLVVTITKNNGEINDVSYTDFESSGLTCSPINGTELLLTTNQVTISDTSLIYNIQQKIKVFESVLDIEGNKYKIITIGNQTWMAENLKSTKYNNGDIIGTTTSPILNISGESTPKYQWAYNGNDDNVSTYGRLYTWYVVVDSRSICPTGWHVPTDDEWKTLVDFIGGESLGGSKLKEIGTTHWLTPNSGATDEFNFTALPAGSRMGDGTFKYIGEYGGWWSSSEEYNAWHRSVYYAGYNISRDFIIRHVGSSVRCIKN